MLILMTGVGMPAQQHLEQVSVSDLRPTQMTVGAPEVALKRASGPAQIQGAGQTAAQPLVSGGQRPQGLFFIVDHHHLGQALCRSR
jgi:hypothetical protein